MILLYGRNAGDGTGGEGRSRAGRGGGGGGHEGGGTPALHRLVSSSSNSASALASSLWPSQKIAFLRMRGSACVRAISISRGTPSSRRSCDSANTACSRTSTSPESVASWVR